jgi:hypothetical protein
LAEIHLVQPTPWRRQASSSDLAVTILQIEGGGETSQTLA